MSYHARYPGRCARCGAAFTPGTYVKGRGRNVRHVFCPASSEDNAPPPYTPPSKPHADMPGVLTEDFPAFAGPRFRPRHGARVRRITFDSMGAFSRYCAATNPWRGDCESWVGGSKDATMEAIAHGGDIRHAAAALDLASRITLPDLDTYKDEALLDIAGGMPLTPAYLSGDPACMLDSRSIRSERGPIRIYVNTVSDCHIPASQMARCGAAVIALGQVLSQVRPVEMWACAIGDDAHVNAVCTRVRLSTPFSLAEAGLLFGDYAVTRGIHYGIFYKASGFTGGYAFRDASNAAVSLSAALPEQGESDLLIGGTNLTHASDNPEAWIQRHVDEAMHAVVEA